MHDCKSVSRLNTHLRLGFLGQIHTCTGLRTFRLLGTVPCWSHERSICSAIGPEQGSGMDTVINSQFLGLGVAPWDQSVHKVQWNYQMAVRALKACRRDIIYLGSNASWVCSSLARSPSEYCHQALTDSASQIAVWGDTIHQIWCGIWLSVFDGGWACL